MKNILISLLAFITIQLFYRLFVIKKDMKYDPNKVGSDLKILLLRYKVDLNKVNYRNLVQVLALVNSLDIALIFFWISFIDKINIECIVGFLLMIPIILISYSIVGNYFKMKGLVINDRNK